LRFKGTAESTGGHEIILLEDLPIRIHEGVNRGAEKKIYIKADARAKYGDVKEVLDGVRSAGVEKIAILVDQRKPQLPPD
jgi:biopolymer transport protein TolR